MIRLGDLVMVKSLPGRLATVTDNSNNLVFVIRLDGEDEPRRANLAELAPLPPSIAALGRHVATMRAGEDA